MQTRGGHEAEQRDTPDGHLFADVVRSTELFASLGGGQAGVLIDSALDGAIAAAGGREVRSLAPWDHRPGRDRVARMNRPSCGLAGAAGASF